MTRQIIIISILTFFIIFIFLPVNKIFAQDRINVRDFGAKGNGIKNDSEAIQTAINEISATGGTVFLPPGVYKMKKGIEVPVGVNILGETNATTGPWQNYLDSQDKNLHHDYQQMRNAGSEWLQFDMYKGTWILVDHGKGDVNSLPTFKLSGNTSIKKIGFVHKGLPPATEKMEQYPPAIGVYSNLETPASREGVTIEDISLANPYIGIVFAIGDDLNNYYQDKKANDVARSLGRHRIHNVMGGPLYRGIMLKGLLDTVDIANIQFNYSNYESGYVVDRTQQAVDIEIARADGINLSNILSFGANKGLVTKPAFVNGTTSIRANNLNLEARIPISLTSGQYEITNSYFLTLNPFGYVEEGEFNGLKVETNSDTVHQSHYMISNSFFQNAVQSSDWTNHLLNITLDDGSNMVIDNSMFWGWDSSAEPDPVIKYYQRGNGPTSLNISNSSFTNTGLNGKLIEISDDSYGYKAGSIVFNSSRFPESLNADSIADENEIWFMNCIEFDSSGNNELLNSH